MYALEIRNLSKNFGEVKAVDKASFQVPEGSVFGLIGRNGAGKTTTIRMMMNIYMPDEGEVILRGAKIDNEFKSRVGYLPEERGLYKKMKVLETLLYFAEIKGKSGRDLEKKARQYLKRFELDDRKYSKIEDLSKGNQQKIQFITAVLHDPDFIILDEPFSGLDPINTNLLREIIMEKKQEGKVIILSTHFMDFAEKMSDHIAMIDHGKVIMNDSLQNIKSKFGQRNITLTHSGDISFLKGSPLIEKITEFGNSTGIRVKEASQTQELLRLLVEKNVEIKKFDANDISLQEVFVELAGKEVDNNGKEAAHA
ncbi:MAG: ATP-binding cassette domain-containing protein [Bacteroidetes bacterium]|nr:ATP-binding cassette domain-containing protein [Bacteroidota bacterium]MBU1679997.1 ATP-binding cassette domain-containing protein [Bacteroidota bacterium]